MRDRYLKEAREKLTNPIGKGSWKKLVFSLGVVSENASILEVVRRERCRVSADEKASFICNASHIGAL